MKNYFLPASILIAAALISGSIIYTKGLSKQPAPPSILNKEESPEVLLRINEDDAVLGDVESPISIVMYADPACSFCMAAEGVNKEVMDYLKSGDPTWRAPVPALVANYVEEGKANLIYRYFPGHGGAEETMAIMACSNKQGKFWETHDLVIENYTLAENGARTKELAKSVGVDMSELDSCLNSDWLSEKMNNDIESGRALGVKGTPAFFINGVILEGAHSFSQFEMIIENLLSR